MTVVFSKFADAQGRQAITLVFRDRDAPFYAPRWDRQTQASLFVDEVANAQLAQDLMGTEVLAGGPAFFVQMGQLLKV